MRQPTTAPAPITAEEAQRISVNAFHVSAVSLFREIRRAERRAYPDCTDESIFCFSLAALYLAGKVDGIREERAKRRKRGKNGQNGPQTPQALAGITR